MENQDLHRDIGRMEGKLDAVLSEMRADKRAIMERVDDHEERLRAIEGSEKERIGAIHAAKWLWSAIAGLVGVLGGILGMLGLR